MWNVLCTIIKTYLSRHENQFLNSPRNRLEQQIWKLGSNSYVNTWNLFCSYKPEPLRPFRMCETEYKSNSYCTIKSTSKLF